MAAGFACAVIPIAFYGLQLSTPRHFITTAWIVLFAAMLWRGRAMMTALLSRRARAVIGIAIAISAVAPLAAGIRLPAPARPSPVFADATLYPTADGLWPMGAYFDFLRRQKHAAREPIDHNQELWASLATVTFEEDGGIVPVYGTAMIPYFELAATLQGKRARNVHPEQFGDYKFLYGDERMLTRSTVPMWTEAEKGRATLALLRTFPKTVVSRAGAAQNVLRVEPGGAPGASDPGVEKRIALGTAFAGNEYRILGEVEGPGDFRIDAQGRVVVFYSERPFEVLVSGRGKGVSAREFHLEAQPLEYAAPSGEVRRLFVATLDGPETAGARLAQVRRDGGAPVYAARAILPVYMSVGDL
jgi:hypothetical protein